MINKSAGNRIFFILSMAKATTLKKRPAKTKRHKQVLSWLFIDTSVSGIIRTGLIGEYGRKIKKQAGRSNELLKVIADYIGCSLRGVPLKGICVVAGPGSFSAVRQGVLAANILAHAYHLPLVGISVDQAAHIKDLATELWGGKLEASDYVAPIYNAEPNIIFSSK